MIGKLRLQLIDLIRGTTVLKVLAELKKHQYLPVNELEAIRKERLDKLFNKAKKYTSYYANYNSFEEVPVLTKDIIRNNTPGLISSGYKKKLHKKKSGGSTGIPLVYYTTTESLSYLWGVIILSWQQAGYQFGDRVGFIAGTSLIKPGWAHTIFYKLFNVDVYPATPINNDILAAHVEKMKKRKVKVIYGYAHVINELATYIKTKGPGYLPDLKGVVSTAEILTDAMRENISSAFGVRVINQYGCNEGGTAGFECEHSKMHLVTNKIAYETHTDGCLLSTDLANDGFIMLKYDTGDMLEFAEEPCKCGRTFPAVNRIIGRIADLVVDDQNNRLHDSYFYFMFKQETSVKQYQVVYNEDKFTIILKTDQSKTQEQYLGYIDTIKEQVKFKEYSIVLNGPFILLKNGKHKQIVDNRKKQTPSKADQQSF